MLRTPTIEWVNIQQQPTTAAMVREHARWKRPSQLRGCGSCQAALGATEPGEAGPFPLWAKLLIAAGFLGTAAMVVGAIVQQRRYG